MDIRYVMSGRDPQTNQALATATEHVAAEGIRLAGAVQPVTGGTARGGWETVPRRLPDGPLRTICGDQCRGLVGLSTGRRGDGAGGRAAGQFGRRAGADRRQIRQAGGGGPRAEGAHRRGLQVGPVGARPAGRTLCLAIAADAAQLPADVDQRRSIGCSAGCVTPAMPPPIDRDTGEHP